MVKWWLPRAGASDEDGEMLDKGSITSVRQEEYCTGLLYDTVTLTVNSTLCTWKLLRQQILNVLTTKK
jgi:hypothetical protein